MKNIKVLLAVFIFCSGVALAQTTHEVQMFIGAGSHGTEFYFEPVGLLIQPGDTVRFIGVTPHHNVVSYHAQHGKEHRVPDGVPPFSSPIVPATQYWEYTFDITGTYDLWCGPHEPWGMAMRVIVGEPGGPAESVITNFSPEGVFGVAGAVLNDVSLQSANIVRAGQVSWQDISDETKAQPVPADEVVGRIMEQYGAPAHEE